MKRTWPLILSCVRVFLFACGFGGSVFVCVLGFFFLFFSQVLGNTALHVAVERNNAATVEQLLKAGALQLENMQRHTPMDRAQCLGLSDMEDLLRGKPRALASSEVRQHVAGNGNVSKKAIGFCCQLFFFSDKM